MLIKIALQIYTLKAEQFTANKTLKSIGIAVTVKLEKNNNIEILCQFVQKKTAFSLFCSSDLCKANIKSKTKKNHEICTQCH